MITETLKRLSEGFQKRAEIVKFRRRIDACKSRNDWDGIGELPEFRIVQRLDTFPKPVDCFAYLFGEEKDEKVFEILNQYTPIAINQMQAGDYVGYFRRHKDPLEGPPEHMGMAVDSKRVQSKFGRAHVYEHPISLVPTYYGNIIRVFRKPRV